MLHGRCAEKIGRLEERIEALERQLAELKSRLAEGEKEHGRRAAAWLQVLAGGMFALAAAAMTVLLLAYVV
jgi:hypothetical protein